MKRTLTIVVHYDDDAKRARDWKTTREKMLHWIVVRIRELPGVERVEAT